MIKFSDALNEMWKRYATEQVRNTKFWLAQQDSIAEHAYFGRLNSLARQDPFFFRGLMAISNQLSHIDGPTYLHPHYVEEILAKASLEVSYRFRLVRYETAPKFEITEPIKFGSISPSESILRKQYKLGVSVEVHELLRGGSTIDTPKELMSWRSYDMFQEVEHLYDIFWHHSEDTIESLDETIEAAICSKDDLAIYLTSSNQTCREIANIRLEKDSA